MSKRIATVITSLIMVGVMFVAQPSAVRADPETIYVGIAGQDYTTAEAGCRDLLSAPNQRIAAGPDSDAAEAVTIASDSANAGGTVYLCPGHYYFHSVAVMQENFTNLIGAGASKTILDGRNSSRIVLTDGSLIVEDLTMQNARGYDHNEGGAILAGGTVQVSRVTFEHNFANKGGGAIAANDLITVSDSTFNNNTAADAGGAIGGHGFVYVTGSTFTGNSSIADDSCIGGGGAIAALDDVWAYNSTFTRNSAVLSGSIYTCASGGMRFGGTGGAIATLGFTFVQDSAFVQNSAALAGGAIFTINFAPTAHSEATVERSTFTKNRAPTGGAIYSNTLSVNASTFTGNVAKVGATRGTLLSPIAGLGGAILSIGNIEVTNSRFVRNQAQRSGGALFLEPIGDSSVMSSDHFAMSKNRFIGNSAGTSGGALGYFSPSASRPTRAEIRKALRLNRFSGNVAARNATIGGVKEPQLFR